MPVKPLVRAGPIQGAKRPGKSGQVAGPTEPATQDLDPTATDVDWVAGLVPALLVLLVFGWTMPQTVTFEDSGLFVMAGHFRGIAHPPGYALYTVLGWFAEQVLGPLGATPAVAYHWLSVVFCAVALFFWVQLARSLGVHRWNAAAGAVFVGLSPVIWSQSQIAEVYSMNLALFLGAAWVLRREGVHSTPIQASVVGLLLGLGISHHWPLFLLSSPFLGVLVWEARARLWLHSRWVFVGIVIGLSPFVYLWIRSWQNPFLSFYGPLQNVGQWIDFILRKGYSGAPNEAKSGSSSSLFGFEAAEMMRQYSWLGLILAAAGVFGWIRQQRWRWLAGVVGGILGGTWLLLAILRSADTEMNRHILMVFPMIPYALLGLIMVVGVEYLSRFLGSNGWILGLSLLMVAVGFQGYRGIHENNLREFTDARDYGRAVLDAVPANAVLITHVDNDAGPIGYLRYVENRRPDVDVYNDRDLLFSNRLSNPFASELERRGKWLQFVESSARPVCFTDIGLGSISRKISKEAVGVIDYGLYKQFSPGSNAGSRKFGRNPVSETYLEQLLKSPLPQDYWARLGRSVVAEQTSRWIEGAYASAAPDWKPEDFATWMARLPADPETRLRWAGLRPFKQVDMKQLRTWLREAEAMMGPQTPVATRAQWHAARGFLDAAEGRKAEARQEFIAGADLLPDLKSNPSIYNLLLEYGEAGDWKSFDAARQKYIGSRPIPENYRQRIKVLDDARARAAK